MENIKFYKNGYLVQKNRQYPMNYSGVDGDVWFLNEYSYPQDKDEMRKIYNEYNDTICDNYENYERVECCTDINFLKKYLTICDQMKINYHVLFCETLMSIPIFNDEVDLSTTNFVFLGYDYAYSGGSFYSCVFNDLCFERLDAFSNIKLNNNGLFNELEEISKFVELRAQLAKSNKLQFELGEFTIYKIWKMNDPGVVTTSE